MVLPDPAEHRGEGDRRRWRPPSPTTPTYPGSGRSAHVSRDRGGRGRSEPGPGRRERRRLSRVRGTPASPTLLLGSTEVGARGRGSRRSAPSGCVARAAEAGQPRVQALAETGAYEGPGPSLSTSRLPPPRFTSGSFGGDPRLGRRVSCLPTPPCRSGTGPGGIAGAGRCPRTVDAPGEPRTGPCSRRSVKSGGATSGAGRRAPGRPAVAVSARFPLLRGIVLPAGAMPPSRDREDDLDGGRTWTSSTARSSAPSSSLVDRAARRGRHSVSLTPRTTIAYATDLFRAYRTTDGGRPGGGQLRAARERPLDDPRPRCQHHVRDPVHDPQRVFIPYTDIGLFTGGETWTGSSTGIPTRWRNTTYWLAFDPEVKDLMWAPSAGRTTCRARRCGGDPGTVPRRRRRLDRMGAATGRSPTRAWRSRRSRTSSSTRGARRGAAR